MLSIRLDTDGKEGLERISAIAGLTPSTIIRLLVKSLCDHADRNKGKIEFPLKLKQLRGQSIELPESILE